MSWDSFWSVYGSLSSDLKKIVCLFGSSCLKPVCFQNILKHPFHNLTHSVFQFLSIRKRIQVFLTLFYYTPFWLWSISCHFSLQPFQIVAFLVDLAVASFCDYLCEFKWVVAVVRCWIVDCKHMKIMKLCWFVENWQCLKVIGFHLDPISSSQPPKMRPGIKAPCIPLRIPPKCP